MDDVASSGCRYHSLRLDESDGFPAQRTIPTTVVVAQDDRLTPASHGERIGDALGPDGRLVSVSHAGHAVPQTHPRVVDDALLDLVNRIGGRRGRGLTAVP